MPFSQGPARLYKKLRSQFWLSSEPSLSESNAEAKALSDCKDETGEEIPKLHTMGDNPLMDAFNNSPPGPKEPVKAEPERVIIVVDGNDALFSREYIIDKKDAEYGGMLAAGDLKRVVKQSVGDKLGDLAQYWIHARIDRQKIAEALANEWNIDKERMRRKLDLFITGFNASTHRVQMVDALIRNFECTYDQFQWFVCDELRMPQTKYVVFAGCHNENYLRFLKYWINDGFREKLALLQAYKELPQGFRELELPIIEDSLDLFMKAHPRGLKLYSESMMSWESHSSDEDGHHPRGQRGDAKAFANHAPEAFAHFPCPTYYLSDFGCEGGEDCPYIHDYPLNARQLRELAKDAKIEPCTNLIQGHPCPNDEACIWGHQCPFNDQCRFLKRKCWFCAAGPTGSETRNIDVVDVAMGPANIAEPDPLQERQDSS